MYPEHGSKPLEPLKWEGNFVILFWQDTGSRPSSFCSVTVSWMECCVSSDQQVFEREYILHGQERISGTRVFSGHICPEKNCACCPSKAFTSIGFCQTSLFLPYLVHCQLLVLCFRIHLSQRRRTSSTVEESLVWDVQQVTEIQPAGQLRVWTRFCWRAQEKQSYRLVEFGTNFLGFATQFSQLVQLNDWTLGKTFPRPCNLRHRQTFLGSSIYLYSLLRVFRRCNYILFLHLFSGFLGDTISAAVMVHDCSPITECKFCLPSCHNEINVWPTNITTRQLMDKSCYSLLCTVPQNLDLRQARNVSKKNCLLNKLLLEECPDFHLISPIRALSNEVFRSGNSPQGSRNRQQTTEVLPEFHKGEVCFSFWINSGLIFSIWHWKNFITRLWGFFCERCVCAKTKTPGFVSL